MMLAPGAWLGILGGGQLGRMLAMAAAELGFRIHIYAPEPDSPAFAVAERHTVAAYEDAGKLEAFARSVSAVTIEFENVPALALEQLARFTLVRPPATALATAQDRILEKTMARGVGVDTPAFADVTTETLPEAVQRIGSPSVLKTRRFGYDGKGQAKIRHPAEAMAAFDSLKRQPCILEAFISFEREVSVVASRSVDGSFMAFDVIENEHRNHILASSTVPARIPAHLASEAIEATRRIGDALAYTGVFAVEYFVTETGKLLFNEVAPRVHNSGHWTIEGAESSQFHQHIRAVAGWPAGSTRRRAPRVVMTNLIGDDVLSVPDIVASRGKSLHLYGKAKARAGRKMGHVTELFWDSE
jgi:5-(carboxyamino)imidazole ribonucleotide synthase